MSSTPFGAAYSGAYDALYRDKDYTAECDFVTASLQRYGSGPHARILDLGCGTGGHAIELAKRGHIVSGVDLSASMLEIARRKAAQAGAERVDFTVGDIETTVVGSGFDVAIMMFAVIGYLTDTQRLVRALRNVRKQMRPGGIFVADFWYGPAVMASPPGDRVRQIEMPDRTIVRVTRARLDTRLQIATIDFSLLDVVPGQSVRKSNETHPMRYFFAQELALLSELAGFSLRCLCGFPALDAIPDESTWNAALIAEAV